MKIITENKTPGGISYAIDENGSKTVVNVTCSTVSCDGVDVVVFHDSNMKILYAPPSSFKRIRLRTQKTLAFRQSAR